jgi:REP element-mobilizing transposase RayT
MSHAYVQNHIHVIFGTKSRAETLSGDLQPRLWAYLGGIARNSSFQIRAVGGTADHVHLLLELPPTISLSRAVCLLKANSSKWIRKRAPLFEWQQGYAAFAVSVSQVPAVMAYIDNQAAHHQRRDFSGELAALLAKHGLSKCRP